VLHLPYHYDTKKHEVRIVCSNWKVKGVRKETYFYCMTCKNQPASVLGNVLKDITLSETSKGFIVDPIVFFLGGGVILCVYGT
jgi:hypothetical protein